MRRTYSVLENRQTISNISNTKNALCFPGSEICIQSMSHDLEDQVVETHPSCCSGGVLVEIVLILHNQDTARRCVILMAITSCAGNKHTSQPSGQALGPPSKLTRSVRSTFMSFVIYSLSTHTDNILHHSVRRIILFHLYLTLRRAPLALRRAPLK